MKSMRKIAQKTAPFSFDAKKMHCGQAKCLRSAWICKWDKEDMQMG
jgi:hypothetical protein